MSKSPDTSNTTDAPDKKKRRIFVWFFLLVQIIFIAWIIGGIASGGDTGDCGSLSAQDCSDAAAVGTGIGVALIFGFWIAVDFLLALIYGIYRLAKR